MSRVYLHSFYQAKAQPSAEISSLLLRTWNVGYLC